MTCECCQFQPVVQALTTLLRTHTVIRNDDASSRKTSAQKELDLIEYKISRESSKRKPKKSVIAPLKKLHPKFRHLISLVRELVESPDGRSPSLMQQVCLACSATSNDDNLSNSGQTFVSIDAMSSNGPSQHGADPTASISLNDNQPLPQDADSNSFDFSPDAEDPSSYDDDETKIAQTSHDFLTANSISDSAANLSSHNDPTPSSSLPPRIHDTLVKYLNDFRNLEPFDQMLILQQWAGGTLTDFASMKWLPREFAHPQSKQLISQRWAKAVAKFPLAAAIKDSVSLSKVSTALSQHYGPSYQLELPGL